MVTGASIRHATTANVFVSLKDVKYEGIWKRFHVHPSANVAAGGRILEANFLCYTRLIRVDHEY